MAEFHHAPCGKPSLARRCPADSPGSPARSLATAGACLIWRAPPSSPRRRNRHPWPGTQPSGPAGDGWVASERVGCERAVWRQNLGLPCRIGRSWGSAALRRRPRVFASGSSHLCLQPLPRPAAARKSFHAHSKHLGRGRVKARTAEKGFKGSHVRTPCEHLALPLRSPPLRPCTTCRHMGPRGAVWPWEHLGHRTILTRSDNAYRPHDRAQRQCATQRARPGHGTFGP
jgi:hypothetical protein